MSEYLPPQVLVLFTLSPMRHQMTLLPHCLVVVLRFVVVIGIVFLPRHATSDGTGGISSDATSLLVTSVTMSFDFLST